MSDVGERAGSNAVSTFGAPMLHGFGLAARRHSSAALVTWGIAAETDEEVGLLRSGEPWTQEMTDRVKSAPAQRLSWLDIWGLGRCEPEAALARFEELKSLARTEVQGG